MASAPVFRRVLAAVTAFGSTAGAQQPQQPQVFLNINPSWSPDGRTILFDSSRDGAFHLYTIRPDGTVYVAARDGSGLRRLTHGTDGVR